MSLMLREIAEQPEALERTIQAERAKIARLGNFLQSRDIDLIVLVARGSSDNAALFGRYLLEITTGIPVSLSAPSVHTLYGAKLNLKHALVVGVSQSGAPRAAHARRDRDPPALHDRARGGVPAPRHRHLDARERTWWRHPG